MQTATRYLQLGHQEEIDRHGNTLAVWSLLLGALAAVAALSIALRSHIPFPIGEEWALLGDLNSKLPFSPAAGPRMPMVRLLVAADVFWFGGRNLLEGFLAVAVPLLQVALFHHLARRTALWPPWMVAAGSGLAAFVAFWPSQYLSFLDPATAALLPGYACATLAISALLRLVDAPKLRWLVATFTAASVAQFTLPSGFLIWPLLLTLAVKFRLPRHQIIALGIFTAAATLLALVGSPLLSGGLDPHFPQLLVALGYSWENLNPTLGQTIAAAGLLFALASLTRELARREPRFFALSILSLCVLFLTAVGFAALRGNSGTRASQTPALLFWLTLALYGLDLGYRHRFRSVMLAACATLLLATGILASFPVSLDQAENLSQRAASGALPLVADVKDDAVVAKLGVDPGVIFQLRPFLLRHHAAFYADPRYRLLGTPLTSRFAVAPFDRCFGAADSEHYLADARFPGWELHGWVWDHYKMRPVEGILASGHDGIVTGAGELAGERERPDVRLVFPEVSDTSVGWKLYLQGPATIPAVKVYGIVDGGKSVCLATPSFPLPSGHKP